MNPQLNKVFSKLAKEDKKTELKSEKVELALVDDIKSAFDEMESYRKIFDRTNTTVLGKIKVLESELKDAKSLKASAEKLFSEKMKNDVSKIISKADNAAKDLGISTKDIKGYNLIKTQKTEFEKLRNLGLNNLKKLDKFIK